MSNREIAAVETEEEGPLAKPLGFSNEENVTVQPPAAVTVAQVAILLAAPDPKRRQVSFWNTHATDQILWGVNTDLTTANGYPLAAGKAQTIVGYRGAIYAIKAATSADVRVLKIQRE